MSDIFLSYKSEDCEKAQKIAEAIEKKGYTVWWDRIISPGLTFDEVIEEKLDEAKCVVVLWSEKSIKAKWVRTEASEGDKRGILVPVMIEVVTPPLAFRRLQAAKLMDWDGTSLNHEFDLLIQSVGRILGRPATMDSHGPEQNEIEEKGKKEQEEHVHLKVEEGAEEKTYTNSIGMKFALIPAGEFMMGSEESDLEKPVHNVTLKKPFYLGVYPVNQKEWKMVMEKNPSHFKGDNLPVEKVSWEDVQKFIKNLNEKESTDRYRLPSEAEWEYAAHAGTSTRYSFGDDKSKLDEYGWYVENSDHKTHPVGQKKSNPWGLYDIHGNVWEWVQDEWHESYEDAPTDGSAWEDGNSALRVVRGGGWAFNAEDCRSAFRDFIDPGDRDGALGFRLHREL